MIVFSNSNPIEVNEEDGRITVEIDPAASGITESTEVEVSTINGSAISTSFANNGVGADFNAINNLTANIDPNNPDTFSFTVDLTDDAIAESNENFQLQITATEDASLSGTANIVIIDNDGVDEPEIELEPTLQPELEPELVVETLLPSISINSVEQQEGDSGTTNFEFTISLSEPSDELITVDYATINGTGESEDTLEDLNLIDLADYNPLDGTVEFNPGEIEQTITVEVLTDTESLLDESPEETFFVNLANVDNATIEQLVGTGTILDDDFETEDDEDTNRNIAILQLENQTFIEGSEGENFTEELIVNLVDAEGEAFVALERISFDYSSVDVTAAANLDYEFINTQSATIAEGQSSVALPITIIGDAELESDETFLIELSNLDLDSVQFNNGQSELEVEITIQDDDDLNDSEDLAEPDAEFEDSEDTTEPDAEFEDSEDLAEPDAEFEDSEDTTEPDAELEDSEDTTEPDTELEDSEDLTEPDAELDNNQNGGGASQPTVDTGNRENTSESTVDLDDGEDASDNTVFRFVDINTGGHFYTDSEVEKESFEQNDNYVSESSSYASVNLENTDDAADVYRFFNSDTGDYLYTTSEIERDAVEQNLDEYLFQNVVFSAFETEIENTVSVYRFYQPSSGLHFYTADEIEKAAIENNQSSYISEGIAFYALPIESDIV